MHLFDKNYKRKVKEYKEKLYAYGIKKIELKGLPLEYWEELVDAFDVMYGEFPEVFRYLLGIFDVNDIEAMNFIAIRSYFEFEQINVLAYININVKNMISDEAIANRIECQEYGFHKAASFKSYVVHELAHLLECVITFKEKMKKDVEKEIFDEYYISYQCHDISKKIFENLYGNLDRRAILGNNAYGNKDVSEFWAEALSEYFCLKEHQLYTEQMYGEMKKLYNKYF